jgi:pyruvate,water dikinase
VTGPAIAWLDAAAPERALLGGKGSGLARLGTAGLRVPPGFVVTTAAYRAAITERLQGRIRAALAGLTVDAPLAELERVAADLRRWVLAATERHDAQRDIEVAYAALCKRGGAELPVAVRSSSVAEDAGEQSFAGEHDSYLWVRGIADVQHRVRDCWASLFTARAVQYTLGGRGSADPDRSETGPADSPVMAVVVQQMVAARSAGAFMTLNPVNGDRSKVVIESVWGLGEPLMSGAVDPDRFLVDKITGEILRRDVAVKHSRMVPDPEAGRGTVLAPLSEEYQRRPSLSDSEVQELVGLARSVERDAGHPQDGEFAVAEGSPPANVFLVQARPETVWSRREQRPVAAGTTAMDSILGTLTRMGGRAEHG